MMHMGYATLFEARHTVYILNGNWPAMTPPVGQFFSIFILIIAVCALAYYTTRLLGAARYGRFGKRNIEIIESMGVGPQSFVHIMRIGEKYVMIGVTRNQINMITELDEGQISLAESHQITGGFESLMGRFIKKEEQQEDDNKN